MLVQPSPHAPTPSVVHMVGTAPCHEAHAAQTDAPPHASHTPKVANTQAHSSCGNCSSCEVCHGAMLTTTAPQNRLYPTRAIVLAPASTYVSVTRAPSLKPPIA